MGLKPEILKSPEGEVKEGEERREEAEVRRVRRAA
jgi:hypothetical protein